MTFCLFLMKAKYRKSIFWAFSVKLISIQNASFYSNLIVNYLDFVFFLFSSSLLPLLVIVLWNISVVIFSHHFTFYIILNTVYIWNVNSNIMHNARSGTSNLLYSDIKLFWNTCSRTICFGMWIKQNFRQRNFQVPCFIPIKNKNLYSL